MKFSPPCALIFLCSLVPAFIRHEANYTKAFVIGPHLAVLLQHLYFTQPARKLISYESPKHSRLVLTICALASCRTTSENYSLIDIDRAFLATAFGDDCVNASSYDIPDIYMAGLSGSCRAKDGVIDCQKDFPPSLNWVRLFEADIAANTSGSQADILEQCMGLIAEKKVDHALNDRLATALFSLLIVSIVFEITAPVIATFLSSAFGYPVFFVDLLDWIIDMVCLGIYVGILNHEVGQYIPHARLGDVSDKAILGVGFWMLLTIFGGRAISHPILFVSTVVIIIVIPLIPILLLLYTCLCLHGRDRVVRDMERDHIWECWYRRAIWHQILSQR
ncbi:uncharacterized protein A1O9_04224 [Exophiala aquamarina CBS 119918]|uniref:Uncharacterized protein n=1 Tax=Exophiala aquamarina CBS 119918 TaxID=1182545 RepID=A0A072PV14_9EURO|nr:uncharacterized protein A1O9_04224 [Exophiala aquamarina CBS 119918]KEF59380.1 hypothetical protein A1O9_04224 [Exophiala aquamarina CBS 119918]